MEPEFQEEQSFGSKLKTDIIELIEFVAVVAAVLVVVRFFIAEPHRVSGHSMVPNFHDSDYIITYKLALRLDTPKRGEVVILHDPRSDDKVFIKRVVGLPGETIKLHAGKVYINDEELSEPYLPIGVKTSGEAFLQNDEPFTIPSGKYFVIGDNRGGSSDSRDFGPIKLEAIIGQAWLRYWPISSLGVIKIDQPSTYQ